MGLSPKGLSPFGLGPMPASSHTILIGYQETSITNRVVIRAVIRAVAIVRTLLYGHVRYQIIGNLTLNPNSTIQRLKYVLGSSYC